MTVLRAQIRWESTNNARDDMMNTWHFKGQRAEADNAADMVEDFYTANGSDTSSLIATRWSNQILTGAYEIKVYDLEDPKPRAPIYWRLGQHNLASTVAAPPQMAICLSYEAEGVSGIRQQRLRGRVYLGGWTRNAIADGGMIGTEYFTRVATSAEDMLAASQASINLSWCTFSPTIASGASNIEDAAFEVAKGWVDDSMDIQRRRAVEPTVRYEWPEV